MSERRYKLELPSSSANIALVESFIENICQDFQVKEELFGNILVSVTEAVNNAIVHGNQLDESKNVALELTENDQQLTFVITDQGTGFDYDNLPDPTSPENLEKPTGRGVFLMRQLSDEVEFIDNGKTVVLKFNRN